MQTEKTHGRRTIDDGKKHYIISARLTPEAFIQLKVLAATREVSRARLVGDAIEELIKDATK